VRLGGAVPRSETGRLDALDRRLAPASAAPLAVGFSGGGDSLFLLKRVLDWAKPRGRPVLALTVDHRLQSDSGRWTAEALAKARSLGAAALALDWIGDKPTTGLPAAARRARHALLAQAARDAGAKVLLLGHTASDLAEAAAMRAQGSSVSDPREWAPSPVWPQGRDVFLLRPLLALTRGEIREALAAEGETWLEDPANADPRYARARVRAQGVAVALDAEPRARPTPPIFTVDAAGSLRLPRTVAAAHLAAALLCAAGTERPPRAERLARLIARLRAGEAFTATLAGARVEAADDVLVCRDAGEAARGGLAAMTLAPGETGVWDGRWEITAGAAPLLVAPLKGRTAALAPAARVRLSTLPAAARPALPLLTPEGGDPCCPALDAPVRAAEGELRMRLLGLDRVKAATGFFDQESVT
jgi:tRNA(Ile)-lysidine synthase